MDRLSSQDLESLDKEAGIVPAVSKESAECYQYRTPLLVKRVNHLMVKRDDLDQLIGKNNLEVMFDTHKHHAAIVTTGLVLGRREILVNNLPWLYRAYCARGFSHEYFPAQIDAWITAVQENLPETYATEILSVYHWMKASHPCIVTLTERTGEVERQGDDPVFMKRKTRFRHHALRGDHRTCLGIAALTAGEPNGIQSLYQRVIQPAMTDIGRMWEYGTISVAEEHLASAVVGRVMMQINMMEYEAPPPKGRAVITIPPGEAHEIGAWMVADLLERDGWDVRYLGSNTPMDSLVRILGEFKPDVLALSVTVSFHLPALGKVIDAVRKTLGTRAPKILVGGDAFHGSGDLWSELGADGFAPDPEQARILTATWVTPCQ